MNNNLFGIVEGFFSHPLPIRTNKQRNNLIYFISSKCSGISQYLYCPKNDEYVTIKPYELYPIDTIAQIEETCCLCEKKGIRFIYGLNPLLSEYDINNSEEVIEKIIKKLKQLYAVGCSNFCLLFDDIPLAYDVLIDGKINNGELIKTIVYIVNEVYGRMSGYTQKRYFCGPDYCMMKKTDLTDGLQKLNNKITIFWTGKYIFSSDEGVVEYNIVQKNIGKKSIALWKNYPVNDLQQNVGQYNINCYKPFSLEEEKMVEVFINPMRECELNYFYFMSMSKFITSKGKKYSPKSSITESVGTILSLNEEESELFLLFSQTDIYHNNTWGLLKLIQDSLCGEKIHNLCHKLDLSLKEFNLYEYLIQIKYFYRIYLRISNNESIVEIISQETFPTYTKNPRYFVEIYTIIEARSRLGYYTEEGIDALSSYKEYVYYYQTYYEGSNGLEKINEFKNQYLQLINEIILLDQKQFCKYCDKNNKLVLEKLKIYVKRRAINRFSLHMFN